MGIVANWLRKKNAAAYLDDQLSTGGMTVEQFDAICMQLSMGGLMTGNLQEAHEMGIGKTVPMAEFLDWLENDKEGRWYKAMWVMLRKGKLDSPYSSVSPM